VIIEPEERPPRPEESDFYLDAERFKKPAPRVLVRIEQVLSPPLLRTNLNADPILRDLTILLLVSRSPHGASAGLTAEVPQRDLREEAGASRQRQARTRIRSGFSRRHEPFC
jgi:hypothetical protein